MAKRESVFGDEWRRCLKEHYKYVVKNQDKRTEETLNPIMADAGFRENDLRQLYLEATLHVDDMPDDFVPDMERVAPESVELNEQTFQVHPAECTCPSCMDIVLEEGHDDHGQPLETVDNEPPDDMPKQKSLF
jgi:hypothetical protein